MPGSAISVASSGSKAGGTGGSIGGSIGGGTGGSIGGTGGSIGGSIGGIGGSIGGTGGSIGGTGGGIGGSIGGTGGSIGGTGGSIGGTGGSIGGTGGGIGGSIGGTGGSIGTAGRCTPVVAAVKQAASNTHFSTPPIAPNNDISSSMAMLERLAQKGTQQSIAREREASERTQGTRSRSGSGGSREAATSGSGAGTGGAGSTGGSGAGGSRDKKMQREQERENQQTIFKRFDFSNIDALAALSEQDAEALQISRSDAVSDYDADSPNPTRTPPRTGTERVARSNPNSAGSSPRETPPASTRRLAGVDLVPAGGARKGSV
jgi:hypothetical protein